MEVDLLIDGGIYASIAFHVVVDPSLPFMKFLVLSRGLGTYREGTLTLSDEGGYLGLENFDFSGLDQQYATA